MLETRLDNVVHRLGLAPSRPNARQLVRHGHIEVNGRRVDIPSYQLKVGDVVRVREKSQKLVMIRQAVDNRRRTEMQAWLDFDDKKLEGRLNEIPSRESIPVPIQEQLIVELYSK
jgi:small subunit ribosomal protein S4